MICMLVGLGVVRILVLGLGGMWVDLVLRTSCHGSSLVACLLGVVLLVLGLCGCSY